MNQTNAKNVGRAAHLERLGNEVFDVLILGGGISGIATANVLIKRGYRVALIDDHDFASGTSQESSQLIWGGIKYLENRHFGVVNELSRDRNALVRDYPSRVQPLHFLYPHYSHDPHYLPTLLLGSYIYWVMGRGFGGRPTLLSNREISEIVPEMQPDGFKGGFQYYDARMLDSDARLTLDFLFDAVDAGLTAANYVRFKNVRRLADADLYELDLEDLSKPEQTRRPISVRAKWIVNTTGIWADQVNEQLDFRSEHRHLFSKGIHVVVKPIETHGRALTCLAKDRRPFFVIPWGAVTLIGTTDTPFAEPPQRVKANESDIEYLRAECRAKFNLHLDPADIISTKAGLRPLVAPAKGSVEDFLALARSHVVWGDPKAHVTALWGGKYTNCFSMAEEIADTIKIPPSAKGNKVKPVHNERVEDLLMRVDNSNMNSFRDACREVCRMELAVKPEDVLRRRTNLALKSPEQAAKVQGFLEEVLAS